MHGATFKEYAQDEIICLQGDPSSDLYFLQSGKLLVCSTQGTEVKAIAHIPAGEFIGELSFFDSSPRSSTLITLEPSILLHIPKQELMGLLPEWYLHVAQNLTKKIRLLDQVLSDRTIRKGHIKPLSIEEQRHYLRLMSGQKT